MGTRCDLYVGRGEQAEWCGSYPFDGFPDSMPPKLLAATTEADYRYQVGAYLAKGGNRSTLPEQGWPWPWENSRLTDYAYAFDSGKVWASCFGGAWFDPLLPRPEQAEDSGELDLSKPPCQDATRVVFPDMSDRKAVTIGPRSGLIVVGIPRE